MVPFPQSFVQAVHHSIAKALERATKRVSTEQRKIWRVVRIHSLPDAVGQAWGRQNNENTQVEQKPTPDLVLERGHESPNTSAQPHVDAQVEQEQAE